MTATTRRLVWLVLAIAVHAAAEETSATRVREELGALAMGVTLPAWLEEHFPRCHEKIENDSYKRKCLWPEHGRRVGSYTAVGVDGNIQQIPAGSVSAPPVRGACTLC